MTITTTTLMTTTYRKDAVSTLGANSALFITKFGDKVGYITVGDPTFHWIMDPIKYADWLELGYIGAVRNTSAQDGWYVGKNFNEMILRLRNSFGGERVKRSQLLDLFEGRSKMLFALHA